MKLMRHFFAMCCLLSLAACGFHPQGQRQVATQLHHVYLQTDDPYGRLARSLKQELKIADIHTTESADDANVILNTLGESTNQELISVSGTQQTRQYRLSVEVSFELTDNKGAPILEKQTLSEYRIITLQSNQILGSANEAQLFYEQMRMKLAHAILNRITSPEVTNDITHHFATNQSRKKKQ